LTWIATLGIAGVFLFAAYEKIADPREFASTIRNYKFLPPAWTNGFALLLPWWELLAAVAVLIPSRSWRRAGAVAILLMSLAFVIAVVRALILGLDISCGCFGHAGSSKIGLKTLSIDAAMIVGSVYLIASTAGPAT